MVLAQYFPPYKFSVKKKRIMRRGMENPQSRTVRHYVASLINKNEYLASFPGATLTENIDITKLNEILLNSMPNSWSKKSARKQCHS